MSRLAALVGWLVALGLFARKVDDYLTGYYSGYAQGEMRGLARGHKRGFNEALDAQMTGR